RGGGNASLRVEAFRQLDDLPVADVAFQGAGVAIGTRNAVEIDAHLPDFPGGTSGAPVEFPVENESAPHPCAEGEADDVATALGGAVFPLGIGHAVGVV